MKQKLQWGTPGMRWGDNFIWGQGFQEITSEDTTLGAVLESQLGGAVLPVPTLKSTELATPTLVSAGVTEISDEPKLGKAGG